MSLDPRFRHMALAALSSATMLGEIDGIIASAAMLIDIAKRRSRYAISDCWQ